MTYAGAAQAAESRKLLGAALEALQKDPNIPKDVLAVAENIAGAVGALFEAEKATSDLDGKASVKHAMGSLSQTMALLQDVKSNHEGIVAATQALAASDVRSCIRWRTSPTMRPSAPASLATPRPWPGSSCGLQAAARSQAKTAPKAADAANSAASSCSAHGPAREARGQRRRHHRVELLRRLLRRNLRGRRVHRHLRHASRWARLVEVLVTLPGNYQFTVPGHVRFVRDPMDMDSEPGIGVRFEGLQTISAS